MLVYQRVIQNSPEIPGPFQTCTILYLQVMNPFPFLAHSYFMPPKNLVVFPHQWVVKPWLFESIDCLDLHGSPYFLWLISWDPMQHLLFFTCNYCNYKLMTSINIIQYWHTINHKSFGANVHDICVQYPGNPGPANACHGFQMFPGTWCWAPPC